MRAHLPLVRALLLLCESERVLARTKKEWKKNQNEVARTKKGLESAWRKQKRAIIFVLKKLIVE